MNHTNGAYNELVSPPNYLPLPPDQSSDYWDLKLPNSPYGSSSNVSRSYDFLYSDDSTELEPTGGTSNDRTNRLVQPAQPTRPHHPHQLHQPHEPPQQTTLPQSAQTKPPETKPQDPSGKPKRKRENRYKNAPPSVISRRRAQNRASQRAYRERKDQRIKDLEENIAELRKRNEVLRVAYETAQRELDQLRANLWQPDYNLNAGMAFPQPSDGGLFGGGHTNFNI
ncbi:hypothetical protein F5Y12DRAFT_749586 [Xylaria sp. FL1777]|nr:hypothetical protein F5Y12DRAFT_749586 [Xylaria sp. FL1777]